MQIDWIVPPKQLTVGELVAIQKPLKVGTLLKVRLIAITSEHDHIKKTISSYQSSEEHVWVVGDIDPFNSEDYYDQVEVVAYSTSLCNLIETAKHSVELAAPTLPQLIAVRTFPPPLLNRFPPLNPKAETLKDENMLDNSQIYELEKILAEIPEENAIERLGFESRIAKLKDDIIKRTEDYIKESK
jgi:hypothetical protein